MTDNLTSQVRDYLTRISATHPSLLTRRDLNHEDTELRRLLGQVLVSLEPNREMLATVTVQLGRYVAHDRESRLGVIVQGDGPETATHEGTAQ